MENNTVDIKLHRIIYQVKEESCSQEEIGSELMVDSDCDLMSDLGYDSILMIQLIVKLEEEFHIEFDLFDLDMSVLSKYESLKNYVITHLDE